MLSDLWYRLRAIFRRRSVERELDDELRFHVERITQKYVRRGHAPGEAARLASLEVGGVEQVKEQCRDARGVGLWEQTVRNLRLALPIAPEAARIRGGGRPHAGAGHRRQQRRVHGHQDDPAAVAGVPGRARN